MSDDTKDTTREITVEDLSAAVLRLQALLASQEPVCPYCKSKLVATAFRSYSDKFDYWACSCPTLPCTKTEYGTFG